LSTDLERYRAAVDYIDREIVRLTPRERSREGKVRAALDFNAALGDPQRAYPSIQVAGTSGKGTVCHLLASALRAAGLGTGCHVSPYLQAFTEKTWIDGRYCSVDALCAAVDEVRPVAELFRADPHCPASVHGMASLATSYVAFERSGIEVAVMETGLGGRFDLVQGLRRELCVITELGLDHTRSLGPTVEEIAWHKAGIMEPGVPCVAVRGAGWTVLEDEARRVGAQLLPLELDQVIRRFEGGSVSLGLPHLGEVELALGGSAPFLARNAAVAAAALDRFAALGWPIARKHLEQGFAIEVPGRYESVSDGPRVILDCAHNAQKIGALCRALTPSRGRLIVIFAATGSRSPTDLLEQIAPLTDRLMATELELYGKAVVPASEIARAARALGLDALAISSPEEALSKTLEEAANDDTIVVTGSVYLVGRLRDLWYSTDGVILQRTSWPDRT
jgi:dihydrofolate synthase/folylpolyglutamate synthase